jgi:hypothetical protein
MAFMVRDLMVTVLPKKSIAWDEFNELRGIVQQTSASSKADIFKAKMKPQSVEQIDELEAKIREALDDLAAHKAKLPQHPRIEDTKSGFRAPYQIRDLMITVFPSDLEPMYCDAGSEFPPGGPNPPPPPPSSPEEHPSAVLEIVLLRALLEHALVRLAGSQTLQTVSPGSIAEVDVLEEKFKAALEILKEMRNELTK